MTKDTKNKKVDAIELFPDLFSHKTRKRLQLDESYEQVEFKEVTGRVSAHLSPPLPPDISWLRSGKVDSSNKDDIDTPSALILMPDGKLRNETVSIIKSYGYLAETVDTPLEAIHRLSFSKYGIVSLHTGFEDRISFTDSVVHNFIRARPMSHRREVYYIVIGPDLHTYYKLAALALSANLVVNDRDIKHLRKILKKGFREHEELFGPLIELLHGRS